MGTAIAGRVGDVGLGYDFVVELKGVRAALLRYAYRLTGNEAARDDLVQDTLLRAWVARHRFAAGTSFRAWLFRIARNSFLSGVRRHNRQIDLPDDEIGRMLTTPPSQEAELHARDMATAIARLPVLQSEALLALNEGQDRYDMVAERLGIPAGTLRSRVSRARRTVAHLIEHSLVPTAANDEPASSDLVAVGTPEVRRDVYAAWKASGSRMIG